MLTMIVMMMTCVYELKELVTAVDRGHFYYILDELTTDEEAKLLAEWKNQDQNQNNPTTQSQLIAIVLECFDELKKQQSVTGSIKLSQIIAKVDKNSLIKMTPTVIGYLAKFVQGLGHEYIIEWMDYVACEVNPKELTISPKWYEEQQNSIDPSHVQ